MCEALGQLRQAVASYATGFDAELVSAADARTVVAEAAAIESGAATIKALAAARAAGAAGDVRRRGARSAAHELARATGTTLGAAREVIESGQALAKQSGVREAAAAGALSASQLALVTGAASADPSAEQHLVEVAASSSLGELRDEATRVKAAHVDLEERRAAVRARRRLRAWTDTDGVWKLRAEGNPEDGAQIMAALAPVADQGFHAARRQGRREPPEAYAFDALVTLALEATGDQPSPPASETSGTASSRTSAPRRRGAPATMLFRLDWDAFLAGVPREGETCELAGHGPVAMSVIHQVLETANPFIVAVLTKAKEVVGVAHLGRRPNAHQRSALQWLYPSCARRGCAEQIPWRPTTAWTGPRPTSPPSTSWTGCAGTTTG
jgi:hypothetical protein